MKIDKKLIKELVDNLDEFKLTELEYQNGDTKIKVSKRTKFSNVGNKSRFFITTISYKISCTFENADRGSPIFGISSVQLFTQQ